MEQQWPDEDVLVHMLEMYKGNTDVGGVQYVYGTSRVAPEAVAKGLMAVMKSRVALAVDVVNGFIFVDAGIFASPVKSGDEQMFSSIGFRALFDLLKSEGVPVRVIEIKKNGSVKYLD